MTAAIGLMPAVTEHAVEFVVDDPDGRFRSVLLYQEVQRPRLGPAFHRRGTSWQLSLPRPPTDRLEYLLVREDTSGSQTFALDETNPLAVPGVFGPKSVVEFPGYRPPRFLEGPARASRRITFLLNVGEDVLPVVLWAPGDSDPEAALPLLVVHDGPEYDTYASLGRYLAWAVHGGHLPPLRAALVPPPPGRRDAAYSADETYARGLVRLVDVLRWLAPHPADAVIGMGASLGALALLHATWRSPRSFRGLVLQSGSFFRPRTDSQERGFAHFERISSFVGEVLNADAGVAQTAVLMTCGTVEENLANNRQVAAALEDLGHDVSFATFADAHAYVAWRDTFEDRVGPWLADVLG